MSDSNFDLLLHRYFERSLSGDEERALWRRIEDDAAAADRFVECSELESGLVERFRSGFREDAGGAVVRVARRAGAVGVQEAPPPPELLAAWRRRLDRVEPSAHRHALGRCLVILEGELRGILEDHYGLGLDADAIARRASRSPEEIEALMFRMKELLLDLVRMRLAVLGEGP